MNVRELIEILSEMDGELAVRILPDAKADLFTDAVDIAEVIVLREIHPIQGEAARILLLPEG